MAGGAYFVSQGRSIKTNSGREFQVEGEVAIQCKKRHSIVRGKSFYILVYSAVTWTHTITRCQCGPPRICPRELWRSRSGWHSQMEPRRLVRGLGRDKRSTHYSTLYATFQQWWYTTWMMSEPLGHVEDFPVQGNPQCAMAMQLVSSNTLMLDLGGR